MRASYITYPTSEFEKMLRQKYYERAGLVSSKAADELCSRLCRWLGGQRYSDNLLIVGAPGTGKTTLIEALMSASQWCAEQGMLTSIRNRINAFRLEEEALLTSGMLDYLANAKGVLIIDDLGCETPVIKIYGRDYRPAERIVKQRSDSQLPTIITSNLTPEDIGKQYSSARMEDVLSEYDKMQIVNNQSFRRIKI